MRSNSLFIAAIVFVVALLISSSMFLVALLLWLAEQMQSLLAALVVVGVGAAVVALLVYLVSLKDELKALRAELSSVFELTAFAKGGYRLIRDAIIMFLKK